MENFPWFLFPFAFKFITFPSPYFPLHLSLSLLFFFLSFFQASFLFARFVFSSFFIFSFLFL